MRLLLILLLLGTLLHQSLLKGKKNMAGKISKKAQMEIIDRFNYHRRNVTPTASNMLKMVWDEAASESARNWVKTCSLKSSNFEKNRKVNGIYCGESQSASNFVRKWSDVIDHWHRAVVNFTYGVATDYRTNHYLGYTQMVWYKSHKVGCAMAYCKGRPTPYYYVCHFCPIGNILEKLATPYKKGPSCGDCPKHCEDKLCTNPCSYTDMMADCKEVATQFDCNHPVMTARCKATCTCKTEII